MKITVIGKGNVGGGLARLWERAGHEVQALGRDGGDASEAEAVLVAVPWGSIEDALGRVAGLDGKVTIDATNAVGGRPSEFESLAHQVKSLTNGPVAKAFNSNFAALYGEIDKQRATPSCIYCADDEAKEVTEQLIRDAGYEPAFAGGLDKARALEDFVPLVFGIVQSGAGRVFYRFATPGEL